jgi:iron complex transport system substrate-binding protein
VVAGGLWEYGVVATGVFGPLRRPDGSADPAIGLADPDDFTSLGEIDSQINLEAMAAGRPQIIVTAMWGEDEYWGIDETQIEQIEALAPVVGIRVDDRSITEPLARLAELAESIIGADSEVVTDAAASFERATDDLRTAIEGNPGLRVVAASGTAAEMYVAYPPGFPELRLYQELGLDLVVPEEHPTSGGFWETLSWEDADKYPVDLILGDARGGTVDQIVEQMPETARRLPAVQAEQLVAWPTVQAYGYGNVARNLDDLTEAVASADPDIA